jgi:hypothetical protein
MDRLAGSFAGLLKTGGTPEREPGRLLWRLGSVGFRGTAALVSRHSSPRSWQRYKRELKALPALDPDTFGALGAVDKSLSEFKPLRLDNFRASTIVGPVGVRGYPSKLPK